MNVLYRSFKGLFKSSLSFFSGVVIGSSIYITVNDYVICIACVEGTSTQSVLNTIYQKQCCNSWSVEYKWG